MYSYFYKDCKVIDGDSLRGNLKLGLFITIEDKVLRFAAINTPECLSKDKNERKTALFCKDYVTELIAPSKIVVVQTEHPDDLDDFGRMLAWLYLFDSKEQALSTPLVRDNSVNSLLLNNGLAWKYGRKWKNLTPDEKTAYLELIKNFENASAS